MSQIHDSGCICNSDNKKPITIQHIDGAVLFKARFCSECISFYENSSTFKIISIQSKTTLNLQKASIRRKFNLDHFDTLTKLSALSSNVDPKIIYIDAKILKKIQDKKVI